MKGGLTLVKITQPVIVAQSSVLTFELCATHTQYSTLASFFQFTVALVSPGSTVTPVGAGAELPPPPHPATSEATTIIAMASVDFNSDSCRQRARRRSRATRFRG